MPDAADLARAGTWARRYRLLGLNPLPSCGHRKRPAMRKYASYLAEPIPARWCDRWWAPNIQVACGVAWRLAVVDLDGPAAQIRWRDLARAAGETPPPTWTVRTGSGGIHLWFRTPEGLDACPTRRLWGIWDATAGAWTPHTGIEVKGDRALIVAPPSKHASTGVEYAFLAGRSPRDIGPPAVLPSWVVDLPAARAPVAYQAPPPRRRPTRPHPHRGPRPGPFPSWRAVLDALSPGLKLDLAVGWGLRLAADHANPAGWMACHAVDRPDRVPSASFCPSSGYYSEVGVTRMNLFDLAVALGAYHSWLDALNDIAEMTA